MNEVKKNSAHVRIPYLEDLRIISALAVIILHICSNPLAFYDEGLSVTEHHIMALIRWACTFCVPVFVMITGTIFLDTVKDTSWRRIITRYIPRILAVILVFGFPFAWMEIVFSERTVSLHQIPQVISNIIQGKLWDHMWYLYMLAGLYTAVPVVKAFTEKASGKEILAFLVILFLFCSVQPYVCSLFNIQSGFYIPFSGIYIFYLTAGFFISKTKIESITVPCTLTAVPIIFLIIGEFSGNTMLAPEKHFGYQNPAVVCLSTGVFLLVRTVREKGSKPLCAVERLGKYTFGIYIFHALILNLAFKFIGFNPLNYPAWIVFFTLLVVTLATSLAVSFIFSHIPFFRKIL